MSDGFTRHELLTVAQAAERLACSAWSVRRWIHKGRLPAVKLGRAVRLRLEDLERAMREGLPAAQEPARR